MGILLGTATPSVAQQVFAKGQAELVSNTRIHDAAPHAAFTDLIRFNNLWFCCFRESDRHVGGRDGIIRILMSSTLENWVEQAVIELEGVDLRDPKLTLTPDQRRLMVIMGGSRYEGSTLLGRRTQVSSTSDGKTWTPPQPVLVEGDWLWGASYNPADSRLYGVAYNTYPTRGAPPEEEETSAKLYSSSDGRLWRLVSALDVPGKPNEASLAFDETGAARMLLRRSGGDQRGVFGTSSAPFREWQWQPLPAPLGGPKLLHLPDGTLVAGSRGYGVTPGAHMVLFRLNDEGGWEAVLELPSAGDCSYPGMVWHDGHLHVSYYSSHEGGTASIYLAKVKLNWVEQGSDP